MSKYHREVLLSPIESKQAFLVATSGGGFWYYSSPPLVRPMQKKTKSTTDFKNSTLRILNIMACEVKPQLIKKKKVTFPWAQKNNSKK
jgi:hypothetical protein